MKQKNLYQVNSNKNKEIATFSDIVIKIRQPFRRECCMKSFRLDSEAEYFFIVFTIPQAVKI